MTVNGPTCAGLVSTAEGRMLRHLARRVPAYLPIIELGSHTGLSTLWMAEQALAPIFAVDPWGDPRPGSDDDPLGLDTGDRTLARFLANLDEHGARLKVTPLRATSTDIGRAWLRDVGLVFIDAVHEYDHVRADIEAWAKWLPIGGTLALHDYTDDPEHGYYGVKLAARDALDLRWSHVSTTGSLAVFERVS